MTRVQASYYCPLIGVGRTVFSNANKSHSNAHTSQYVTYLYFPNTDTSHYVQKIGKNSISGTKKEVLKVFSLSSSHV